jgi:hypothetical protein
MKMMKKSLLTMLALAASLGAAQDYSGIYNGKAVVQSARYPGGVPYTVQITLIQAGTSLTGTLKIGNSKPIPIVSGTASGGSLTFATAGKVQSTAQLTANGNELAGRMTTSVGAVYAVALAKN